MSAKAILSSYTVNNVHDKTMYDITLNFTGLPPYTVTVNFPDVTDEQELDTEILHFAEQHIAEMQPHPLTRLIGKTREV